MTGWSAFCSAIELLPKKELLVVDPSSKEANLFMNFGAQ